MFPFPILVGPVITAPPSSIRSEAFLFGQTDLALASSDGGVANAHAAQDEEGDAKASSLGAKARMPHPFGGSRKSVRNDTLGREQETGFVVPSMLERHVIWMKRMARRFLAAVRRSERWGTAPRLRRQQKRPPRGDLFH
ncbi:hypothetical protein [Dyella choica]|uniref:Uncharacterized protein n=1 Tax=Dyella choica TaxID=1927959 RepID=A0A3S0S1U9_9GAMM|nr:hypothetical protein [Dyella choica]RUL78175.1 hypothetical protein EKH80_04840 [Dyella choica]